MDAGGSIVEYERYLDDHDPARLDAIERYNQDDCESTLGLRNWLEDRRVEAETQFGAIPRFVSNDGKPSESVSEREAIVAALATQLTDGVSDARDERDDEQQARWLLARMLDWHRREDKPDWWMYYARQKMSDDALLDDRECIGGLRYFGDVEPLARSMVQRYEFSPQDHKFKVGDKVHDSLDGSYAGEVVDLSDVEGWIDLKRGPSLLAGAHPHALIPAPPIDNDAVETAIQRLAEHVVEHGLHAPGKYRAALDLLLRTRRDAIDGPFDRSYLAIQGPPGSGKTTKGAELIVELVAQGKRVGITAHSHAVIGNLIEAVGKRDADVSVLQKANDHQRCKDVDDWCNEPKVIEARYEEFDVIAGTAWLWARECMEGSIDVLFVDEAGQKSLADVLAVSGATKQLVLLGDPQQLAQPSKGSHPEGAEVSALEHVLGDASTMPSDLGWFLEHTYRMHPKICEFISDVVYDGRLHPTPGEGLERQAVDGFAGLRYVPVVHEGNRSWSIGEVEVVDEMVRGLTGQDWTDRCGQRRPLTLDEILVVTPYNAQVAKLTEALPEGARIGTVDKFQGQEAPVVIYSMATSRADDVPRGMEFLYDLHRLNVAASRAKAASVIVSSAHLTCSSCASQNQLRLVNAHCRFVEGSA
jgi:uncharacterized protein